MGGNVDTGSSSSQLSNPAFNTLATNLGTYLNSSLSAGVKPDTTVRVPGLSAETRQGVSELTANAATSPFMAGTTGALGDLGAIASGQRYGMNDSGYATLRQNVADDTLRDVNAMFTSSGRFGSGSHVNSAAEGLGNALAGLDYGNFQNDQQRQFQAAGMLPGLYQGALQPGMAALQSGQVVDANNQARMQDEARVFDAIYNNSWNTLGRTAQLFSGTAGQTGTTSTESLPWWRVGTGLASTFAGLA